MKHTISMIALPLMAIGLGLVAQTKSTIFQISGPTGGFVSALVARSSGALVWARLAGGLTLQENQDGTAALIAIPSTAAAVTTIVNEAVRFDPATHKATLKREPIAGSVRLYRNGLRQTEGVDYTRDGAVITDSPYYVAMVPYESTMLADYEVKQ